jgi:hypothetical protein
METTSKPRGWPLFLVGFLILIAGPVIYFVQFSQGQLITPWYLPILGTAGVLVMMLAYLRCHRVWCGILTLLFLAFCGLEWFFLLQVSLIPAYTGPAQPGATLPTFSATLADGKAFSNGDLESGKPSILLFFRGHW